MDYASTAESVGGGPYEVRYNAYVVGSLIFTGDAPGIADASKGVLILIVLVGAQRYPATDVGLGIPSSPRQ